jgi:hypothetical protein
MYSVPSTAKRLYYFTVNHEYNCISIKLLRESSDHSMLLGACGAEYLVREIWHHLSCGVAMPQKLEL